MLEKLKKIWKFYNKKTTVSNKEISSDNEVDISLINDLTQQKHVCSKMFNILQVGETNAKNRFITAQTVSDFLESDANIRANIGEFVGYHFGSINHNMIMISSAMNNLRGFYDGNLDLVDSPARGMYVNIWYNIGLSNLELMEDSMTHLETLENDLVNKELAEHGDDMIILRKGTTH